MADRESIQSIELQGDGNVVALRHNGAPVGKTERKELLARLRAGEVIELEMDAVTFIQRATPNKNFVRIREGALRAFASHFKDKPFLRDHEWRNLLARGGTVKRSRLERAADGSAELHQTIELVKPWAVEGALDGTIDRFSIGFSIGAGDIQCSACGKSLISPDCRHWPGDQLEDGRFVEAIFTDPEPRESSGVTMPAVDGTHIEGIRAALAEARLEVRKTKEKPMKEIAKILGLAEDASEAKIVAELEALKAKLDANKEALASVTAERDAARAKLVELEQAKLAERRAAVVEKGLDEGLFVKGSALEERVRKLAEKDIEAAEALLADLPKVVPVKERQATDDDPTPREDGSLTELEKLYAKQLEVSEEDFLKQKRAQQTA